jgi:hypothetical protein
LIDSLDKALHELILNAMIRYNGYKTTIIDTTGLTDEQIGENLDFEINQKLLDYSSNYGNSDNEPVDGENFVYHIPKDKIGIIIDGKSQLTILINYFRRRVNVKQNNSAVEIGSDYGVGTIVAKKTDDDSIYIIPKDKFG